MSRDRQDQMKGWARQAAIALAAALLLGSLLEAQEKEKGLAIGDEVVLRQPDLTLRANQRDVPTGWDCLKYRVQKLEGPWAWITSDTASGWIAADKVVTFDQAVECYTQALEADPYAAWAYLWRAQAHYYRDELDAAIADLDVAVKRNPRDASALVQRGIVRLDRDETDQAIADFDRAQRIAPGDPDVSINRALAYHASGRGEKALADIDHAIKIDPSSSEAHTVKGIILADDEQNEEALAAFDEAVRLNPRRAETYLKRGEVRYNLGQLDWALAELNEAIRLDPSLLAAYKYRGHVKLSIADDAGALADYQEAARLGPDDESALNDLAWFLAACPDAAFRDGRQAVEFAKHAADLTEWHDPDVLDTLAAAQAEAGNFEEAQKLQAQVLELAPADSENRSLYEEHQALFKKRQPCRLER